MTETLILRTATFNDFEFAYQTKKAAMKTYIDEAYGWDEDEQRRLHTQRFNTTEFRVIQKSGKGVGILSSSRQPDCIKVNQIYILPEYQNRGIGKEIITLIIKDAVKLGLLVQLQVLKVNPRAQVFYHRLGFIKTGESETHILLEKRL